MRGLALIAFALVASMVKGFVVSPTFKGTTAGVYWLQSEARDRGEIAFAHYNPAVYSSRSTFCFVAPFRVRVCRAMSFSTSLRTSDTLDSVSAVLRVVHVNR